MVTKDEYYLRYPKDMLEARGKGGIEAEVEASRMNRITKMKKCEIEESNSLTILID